MIGRVGCVVLVFTASFCFTFVTSLYAGFSSEWNYSRAASCAQQEKWTDAQQGMSQLMVDNSDDAALLYDSGIVAYRMKEFETAEVYFGQAVCCDGICDTLKKQTYFNLGNTKVELKKLTDAIGAYESVLAIDSDDERAKHNLEVVRQMLQQQQQDDKNNQQNQQDNKQDKDKQSQNQNQDQEQQSSADEQKQDGANEHDAQQQSQSTDTQEKKGKQKNDGEMNDSQSGGQPEESQNSNEQEERDGKGNAHDESNDKSYDQEQKQRSGHDPPPPKDSEKIGEQETKNSNFYNTQQDRKEQEMQAGTIDDASQQEDMRQQQHKKLEQELAPHERWMARVLQQREAADEHANKRMVKAAIDKELAGKDGQNCW